MSFVVNCLKEGDNITSAIAYSYGKAKYKSVRGLEKVIEKIRNGFYVCKEFTEIDPQFKK
jgi:hypothetical protein